jgi:ribosomal protein L37AE/L43A
MIEVAAVLGAIQASIDYAKGVSETMKAIKEVEQKIAFLNMREQQVVLMENLLDAKEKISELHAQLILKEQMEHQEDGNILWRIEGQKKCGPYCSTCYGETGKAITLSAGGAGIWHCPKCKNHFHTKQWGVDQLVNRRELKRSHGWQ